MGPDYEVSGKDDTQVPDSGDNDMVVVKDEDVDGNSLPHMYGGSFVLPLAKQDCKTASETVRESSGVLTSAGKVNLERTSNRLPKVC